MRVEKHGRGPPLAAPIRRVLYLSSECTAREHEVWPPPNPALLAQLDAAAAVIYGMGSLYTSICPSLALQACRTGPWCLLELTAPLCLPVSVKGGTKRGAQ